VETAKGILASHKDHIRMPVDLAVKAGGAREEYAIGTLPKDAAALDIGTKTAEAYQKIIMGAKTVFVNGPMGVFEEAPTEKGTKMVWDALGDTAAYTVLGGGDSITATKKYGKTGKVGYICTGGGALIRFLTGEELPVVKALRHGSKLKS
jgi:phosphoglycerate kinase